MKAILAHDKKGKIIQVAIANPNSGLKVTARPKKGLSAAEIELPNLDLAGPKRSRGLADIARRFRVRRGANGAELVETKRKKK